jgi:hypothetical protein
MNEIESNLNSTENLNEEVSAKNKLLSFYKKNKRLLVVTLIFVSLLLTFSGIWGFSRFQKSNQEITDHTTLQEIAPSKLQNMDEEFAINDESQANEASETVLGTPIPPTPTTTTSTPKPTPIPTTTTTPRVPSPPIINISYPSEMQTISLEENKKLCIVDTPIGGNLEGIQRRDHITGNDWTPYYNMSTLCYFPKEGLNEIKLQYKNKYGDESQIYTRKFTYNKIRYIDISINGLLYRDENCNAIRDGGESGIGTVATVNVMQLPEYFIYKTVSTDSSGNYSVSGMIYENQSISLKPNPVSPSGYKSHPTYTTPTVTLNKDNRVVTIDIPQVPNENVGDCSF